MGKKKIKVLIGCLSFSNLTGSELHIYELAKELVKLNCDVTICSNCGGEISKRATKLGIKLCSFSEPPGYRQVGQGEYELIKPVHFDILHLNHLPVAKLLTQLFPETKAISTIHSEVISLENPLKHKNIKSYIAIRPEIKEYINKKHGIPENITQVIYNPIDGDRFRKIESKPTDEKRILFVGTIDYLRKDTLIDLIKTTEEEEKELWVVGMDNSNFIKKLIKGKKHVSHFQPTWDIEKYIQQCDETAGILLGRTTIEGWMCGKKGWIYDVNDRGQIQSKALHDVPTDIDKFNSSVVANKVVEEYKKIIK